MRLELSDAPRASDLAALEDEINRYNVERLNAHDFRALAVFLRDADGGMQGGVSGYTWAGFCEIRFLWVAEGVRGRGYGTRLLASAEAEARSRGCRSVVLQSYSFQAPDFYLKLGYAELGRAEDCPPGGAQVYLQKRL